MTLLTRRGLLAGAAGLAAPKKKRRWPVGMQPDQQGVFFQLVIQGGGTFTYDAAGNLRSANVGQTITDPIQGITCYAGFDTFNGHGAIISLFSSTLDVQLWYADTGSSAQGALTSSTASLAGTDPFGNAYLEGIANYTTVGGTTSVVNLDAGVCSFATATSPAGPFTTIANFLGNELIVLAAGGAAQIRSTTNLRLAPQVVIASLPSPPATSALLEVQGAEAVTGAGGGLLTVTETAGAPGSPPTQLVGHALGDRCFGIHTTGDTSQRLAIDSAGKISWTVGSGGSVGQLDLQAANILEVISADLDIATVGKGLQIKQGANAKAGTAVLVGGTVVVANTSVTTNSIILLGQVTPGGTVGAPFVSAKTAGTGFTIKSTSSTDTSTVGYVIVEPG